MRVFTNSCAEPEIQRTVRQTNGDIRATVITAFGESVMKISPLAGKPAPASLLVNVPRLVTAYYTEQPDPSVPAQRVAFGTSGHRGSAFDKAFNEWHILAISQAICLYRKQHKIDGRCFLAWIRMRSQLQR